MPKPIEDVKVDDHVMVRLLGSLIKCDRPCRRTELGMSAGVNYTLLQKYLMIAQQNKLVNVWKTDETTTLVDITDYGRQAHRDLSRWKLDTHKRQSPEHPVAIFSSASIPDSEQNAIRKRTSRRYRRSR